MWALYYSPYGKVAIHIYWYLINAMEPGADHHSCNIYYISTFLPYITGMVSATRYWGNNNLGYSLSEDQKAGPNYPSSGCDMA